MEKIEIIFLTHPSVHSAFVLKHLLKNPEIKIKGVILSSALVSRNNSYFKDLIKLITQSGLRYLFYLGWATTLYHALAKIIKSYETIDSLGKKAKLCTHKTNDINSINSQSFLEKYSNCLGVTCFFNQILSEKTITILKPGFINLHPSLLPKNKGVDPTFYRRLRKEEKSGVTIHKINKEIDEGELLIQKEIEVKDYKSLLHETFIHFYHLALLLENLLTKPDDKKIIQHHQIQGGNYDSWPTKKMCKKIDHYISLSETKKILSLMRSQ